MLSDVDMIRHFDIRLDAIRFVSILCLSMTLGTMWFDLHDLIRLYSICFDGILLHMIQFDSMRSSSIRLDAVRFDRIRCDLTRFGSMRFGNMRCDSMKFDANSVEIWRHSIRLATLSLDAILLDSM
jgi:hypothetical protein